MSTVNVSTSVYAVTHVATNMLRGLKQIVAGCGLDTAKLVEQWSLLEAGIGAWVSSPTSRSWCSRCGTRRARAG